MFNPYSQIVFPQIDIFSDSTSSDEEEDEEELELLALMGMTIESLQETRAEKKKRIQINRDRKEANKLLMHDYFDPDCVYNEEQFEERNRLTKRVFLRISEDLAERYDYFKMGWDCAGKRGFTTLQKVTSAIRQLGYGIAADANDEYLKMAERTSLECVYRFCECLHEVYGKIYLRGPSRKDVQKLYAYHEAKHGLPGMLGSIDCTHWKWKNCPNAWRGQYTRGDHDGPTVILEGVASQDLWFWHAFFGMPGSCNDLNVLSASPILEHILQGKAADEPYVVNGNEYTFGYYLGDGMYPNQATFVKAFSFPQDERRKLFTTVQEAARKDVERAFGVLKGKWHILAHPARTWDKDKMTTVMMACVILHNMMVEDSGRLICPYDPEDDYNPPAKFVMGTPEYLNRMVAIQNIETFSNLREDLTQHVWNNRR